MINEGLILVKEKLSSRNIQDYPPTFLILQSIINTNTAPQESIAKWFEELSGPLIEIGGGLTQGIMEEINNLVQLEDVQKQEEKLVGVYHGYLFICLWIVLILKKD